MIGFSEKEPLSWRNERIFEELENALHTREGSTTLIATVASSASIILLGAFLSAPDGSLMGRGFGGFAALLGVAFPILGEAYRESTISSIDAADFADIRTMLGSRYSSLLRQRDKVRRIRTIRLTSIRSMLLGPTWTWLAVLTLNNPIESQNLGAVYVGLIGSFLVTLYILYDLEKSVKASMDELAR